MNLMKNSKGCENMNSIALDFKNNMVCLMTAGQQRTESNPDIQRVAFNSFIPEQFRNRTSFTWNFEDETFTVNHDYELHEGCIMTKDCFIPELILPMPNLSKRYDEFIAILGYSQIDLKTEMPAALRKLLGLE